MIEGVNAEMNEERRMMKFQKHSIKILYDLHAAIELMMIIFYRHSPILNNKDICMT